MEEKILYKEERYKMIGLGMTMHSTMGNGFLEAVDCEVLEKKFIRNNIPYQREVKLDLFFNGEKLDKKYKADFVCFDNMILEVKSVSFLHENFTKQTLNDLKATHKKLGLLINFGEKSLKYKRIIN